jgi:glycerol-3-phosphate dehydrogenase
MDTRDLTRLSSECFDVLVVGGGAAGAATAREAALRGFSTALIEREDFSAGSSAHCFKVVHGGIRYLQHGDIGRLRASCRERAALLQIAPHLVAPLPFVVPTYGLGRSSRWFLGAGMLLYDALTADMNAYIGDPARRISRTRFLGRAETLETFPFVTERNLTGATVFDDGQMHSPPRLVLAFMSAAKSLGAAAANYVEAESLLRRGSRVIGVAARDRINGSRFDIQARLVVNAAGPWAEGLLEQSEAQPPGHSGTYSRDACFVVARKCTANMAVAVQGGTRDTDALVARDARHLFMVPWRDHTLVGVWHKIVPREPDAVGMSRAELTQYLNEINASCPALGLSESEVVRADFGLVPFGEASRQNGGLSFGKESRLIDHRPQGVSGLLSLISVRYTVARRDAAVTLDRAEGQLGRRRAGRDSVRHPLTGGNVPDIAALEHRVRGTAPEWLPPTLVSGLVRNYGSETANLIAVGETEPNLRTRFSGSHVTFAEAIYGVRAEMAQCMADVVFRRTELGTAGHPGAQALTELQSLLKRELGWTNPRAGEEMARVEAEFSRYLAQPQQLATCRT